MQRVIEMACVEPVPVYITVVVHNKILRQAAVQCKPKAALVVIRCQILWFTFSAPKISLVSLVRQ